MTSTVATRIAGIIGRFESSTADTVLVPTQPAGLFRTLNAKLRQGDQFVLFIIAALGMFILSPRLVLRAYDVIAEGFTGAPVAVDWHAWRSLPNLLPAGVTVALLTFRLNRVMRLSALVATLGVVAVLKGPLTPPTILPLTVFALTAYALIRLPWSRFIVGMLVFGFMVVSVVVVKRWWGGTGAPAVIAGFPVVLPLLWYSVYEHRQDAALSLKRFMLFVGGRLVGSPVLTYRDLFSTAEGAQLTATRWAGVRAIYIALIASLFAQFVNALSGVVDVSSMTGVPLLVMSYLAYVGYCCGFVVRFNIFIGVLRLAGIPIRSNFRYWLLARTPNEHWQRWNLLAREWFLTFVFYPIMRARRWLFGAIMMSLLVTGVLHVLPRILLDGIGIPEFTARTAYWLVNGLAIYLVIKIPAKFPHLVETLGMPGSKVWTVVGIVLTSAFYAFLHGMRSASTSWGEMAQFLGRLLSVLPT